MIELRADGSIPGPDTFGRIYKVVNTCTGQVGYNYTANDSPIMDPSNVAMIEAYDTFAGWATPVLPIKEIKTKVTALNKAPPEFMETDHTKLVKRVEKRLREGDAGVIDGHRVLDDMLAMFHDIQGRRARPPLDGWPRCDGRDGFNGSVIIDSVP